LNLWVGNPGIQRAGGRCLPSGKAWTLLQPSSDNLRASQWSQWWWRPRCVSTPEMLQGALRTRGKWERKEAMGKKAWLKLSPNPCDLGLGLTGWGASKSESWGRERERERGREVFAC
jgi:hypothetical protein